MEKKSVSLRCLFRQTTKGQNVLLFQATKLFIIEATYLKYIQSCCPFKNLLNKRQSNHFQKYKKFFRFLIER